MQREKVAFFFQAWPPLNKVKRKRERQKKGLDYTKKLVDVLHIPGKNQSVSIRSLHFLSTAPNLFNFNSFSCPSFQSSFFPPLHLNNHGLFQSVEKKKSQKSELIKHTQPHTDTDTTALVIKILHTLDRISVMTPGLEGAFRGKALCYRDNSVNARKEGKAGRETRDGASYLFFSLR